MILCLKREKHFESMTQNCQASKIQLGCEVDKEEKSADQQHRHTVKLRHCVILMEIVDNNSNFRMVIATLHCRDITIQVMIWLTHSL